VGILFFHLDVVLVHRRELGSIEQAIIGVANLTLAGANTSQIGSSFGRGHGGR
jgi:hypothetical protein